MLFSYLSGSRVVLCWTTRGLSISLRKLKGVRHSQSSYSRLCSSSNFISLDDALQLWNDANQKDDSASVAPKKVQFLDASWYHKGEKDEGRKTFAKGPRIPGSLYFDLDELCTTKSSAMESHVDEEQDTITVSHMLPTPQQFGAAMDHWKIDPDTHIVIYGQSLRATFLPRAWFTFKAAMQHPGPVQILNGTLADWKGPLDETPQEAVPPLPLVIAGDGNQNDNPLDDDSIRNSSAYFQNRQALPQLHTSVTSYDHVLKDAGGQPTIVLDARGSSFAKGHMPGAVHVPYSSLMASKEEGAYFASKEKLQSIFSKAGVDLTTSQTIVCSCGSGVSACSLYLALEECGRDVTGSNTLMYDGSWQEWKQIPQLPKVLPPKADAPTVETTTVSPPKSFLECFREPFASAFQSSMSSSSSNTIINLLPPASSETGQENSQPLRQQLFASPIIPALYERILPPLWEAGLRIGGPEAEYKAATSFLKPQSDQRVLDLSCGTGFVGTRLAKDYQHVFLLDYSQEMLQECLSSHPELFSDKPSTNLSLLRGDAGQLPFADNSLDAIHWGAALHCVPDAEQAMREVYRVLKPNGGKVYATTFLKPFPSIIFRFFTLDELQEICQQAGFQGKGSSLLAVEGQGVYGIIRAIK